MDYSKNMILTVTITDMSDNGEGVGKINGYTLFVKDAIVGDTVKAKLTKVKKNYSYARLEEIITPSSDRVQALCPLHKRCGGCQLQAMSYPAQLKFKENKVKNNLIRIGGINDSYVESIFEPIIGMEEPFEYRNKSQYPIGSDKDKNPIAGFYAGRTHDIIPCSRCFLAPPENQEIIEILLAHMKKYNIPSYSEISGEGTIRHLLIRKGFTSGEIMVCIVVKHVHKIKGGCKEKECYIPHEEELVENLCKVEGVQSICVSVNNLNTNVIMGNEIHTIRGKDKIEDTLLGNRYEISPLSFYQVNLVQVEKLYETAVEFADLKGDEEVWDICCGIGTITLSMAAKAKFVHGIEIVLPAIEDARKNASFNNVKNVDFICAAAEEYLPENKEKIKADVIVLDPPRKGMDERALRVICDVAPQKIVYVSCDSATLSRDVKFLCENGYELRRIRCTDMFPQTVHVETVCLLSKKKATDFVEIGVDAEDYYRIKEK